MAFGNGMGARRVGRAMMGGRRQQKPGRAAVIGAGIGGLAVANILARTGWEVAVYERHEHPGGRAGRLEVEGFCFDTGPSWYLMPEVFEHYFGLLGEEVSRHLDLRRLDPAYQLRIDQGPEARISSDFDHNKATFEELERGSAKRLRRYIDEAEHTYGLAMRHFLYNPFTNPLTLVAPEVVRHLPELMRQVTRPIDAQVRGVVSSPLLQRMLEYPMVFLGASPYEAPALYQLMSYLDQRQGVFYPMGGMYEIVLALERVGRSMGVTYHYGAEVTDIEVQGGRARGVRVDDEMLPADIVVSGADLHFTETRLLPKEARTYPERWWRRRVAGPSALLMYLGVRGALPQLDHHSLFLVEDWRRNFDDIFERGVWPRPASLYVSRTTATDPGVAPAGHENLVVLVPLPAGVELSPEATEAAADAYLSQLAEVAGVPDLRERIVVKRVVGPADFARDYHAWRGTALGMAHILRQSAVLRPGSRSRRVSNLLYVGGGVQPGIGVPMCLISAELVYKHLAGDSSAGPLADLNLPTGGWHV